MPSPPLRRGGPAMPRCAAGAADLPSVAPLRSRIRTTRRRGRSAAGRGSAAGGGTSGARRGAGPATPQLHWGDACGDGEEARVQVSIRRLAAAVWRLRPPEVAPGAGGGGSRVGIEDVPRYLQVQLKQNVPGFYHRFKNEVSSPISVLEPKSGELQKEQHDPTLTVLPEMEAMPVAIQREKQAAEASEEDDAFVIASQLNTLSLRESNHTSDLQLELQQAKDRIKELESERQSAKKKLNRFLEKLAEEKAAWRSREHEKVRLIVEDMKDGLEKERKGRRQMEALNAKLIEELKEMKLSMKQLFQDCKKEKKARELVEEVCNELAREVEDDKAEIEALRLECIKIREEVDEERRMLQMAEVWREERVQMKLIDAKVMLEAKYAELGKLQQDVEAFLRVNGHSYNGNMPAFAKALELQRALASAEFRERDEFVYDPPPASEDILAVFEEVRPKEDDEIKVIEPCYRIEAEIQEASPATELCTEKPGMAKLYSSRSAIESITEDDSSWETISRIGDSSRSPEGSEPSVDNKARRASISWVCESDLVDNISGHVKQSKKGSSAISKLWKSSSRLKNSELTTDAMSGGRLSNARLSVCGTYSPDCLAGIAEWSSPRSSAAAGDLSSKGFGGFVESPVASSAVQKQSLKAKLMEVRTESQKVQLRHVLKQKL